MQTYKFKCWQGNRKKTLWSNRQEFANAGEMLVGFHVLIFICFLSCRSLCHIHTVWRGPDVPGIGHPGSLYLLFVRSVILCSLVPPITSSYTVFSVCLMTVSPERASQLLSTPSICAVFPLVAATTLPCDCWLKDPPLSLRDVYYREKHAYLFQTAQNFCFKCLAYTITSECILSEHMRDVPWNIWVTEETELSLKVILLMQKAPHFLEYAARIWRP